MAHEKARIAVSKGGQFCGFIKSVSYSNMKFTLTQNRSDAKGYVRADIINGEIDFLAKISGHLGYVFYYN